MNYEDSIMNTVAVVNSGSEWLRPTFPSAADSAELSLDELIKLYLLSMLLVADKGLAEECFSDAMGDYLGSSVVNVAAWARTNGRLAVVQHAIRLMRPTPKLFCTWSRAGNPRPSISPEHQPFAAITSLSVFERFVYVLCILEGYSANDCAALLNCDRTEVIAGRDLANLFTSAADLDSEYGNWLDPRIPPIHERCGIC
ncbi:MAG: hypothetical protein WA399_07035 [Acidobacteriaceae bacterium]